MDKITIMGQVCLSMYFYDGFKCCKVHFIITDLSLKYVLFFSGVLMKYSVWLLVLYIDILLFIVVSCIVSRLFFLYLKVHYVTFSLACKQTKLLIQETVVCRS